MSDSVSGGVQDRQEARPRGWRVVFSMRPIRCNTRFAQRRPASRRCAEVIRAQPITAALVVFALGILIRSSGVPDSSRH